MEYNGYMTRNHFSKYGGPCFINNGFTKHNDVSTTRVSVIDKVKAFLSPAFGATNNPIRHYDQGQKIPESFAGSRNQYT
jgi:hypothetical protein